MLSRHDLGNQGDLSGLLTPFFRLSGTVQYNCGNPFQGYITI